MNLSYRFFQSVVKVHTIFCAARRFFSERARAHNHITKYHIGMIDKILIHGNAVLICGKVNPIGFSFDDTIALLQKDNVRYYARTCIILKGIVGQTDRTDKIGTLREILSDGWTRFIKCTAACDERYDTAGTHLIQCFRKEKVMDQEVVLIVLPIHNLELTERHVTDCHVEEAIGKLCFLISVYGNALFLIKLTCDSARNAVKLYTVYLGLIHRFGQKTDEVADTARGFKDIPTLESHIPKCIIHGFDDDGRCVESRQGGFSCRFVFFWSERKFQFFIFLRPIRSADIKSIGKTAPARVLCKNFLFGRCCQTAFSLKCMQKVDRRHIASELFFRSANTKRIIGNAIIALLSRKLCGCNLIDRCFFLLVLHYGNGHFSSFVLQETRKFIIVNIHKLIERKLGEERIIQFCQRIKLHGIE